MENSYRLTLETTLISLENRNGMKQESIHLAQFDDYARTTGLSKCFLIPLWIYSFLITEKCTRLAGEVDEQFSLHRISDLKRLRAPFSDHSAPPSNMSILAKAMKSCARHLNGRVSRE